MLTQEKIDAVKKTVFKAVPFDDGRFKRFLHKFKLIEGDNEYKLDMFVPQDRGEYYKFLSYFNELIFHPQSKKSSESIYSCFKLLSCNPSLSEILMVVEKVVEMGNGPLILNALILFFWKGNFQ